jgi:hypothetical protein
MCLIRDSQHYEERGAAECCTAGQAQCKASADHPPADLAARPSIAITGLRDRQKTVLEQSEPFP